MGADSWGDQTLADWSAEATKAGEATVNYLGAAHLAILQDSSVWVSLETKQRHLQKASRRQGQLEHRPLGSHFLLLAQPSYCKQRSGP
jgi:hypothetical protein